MVYDTQDIINRIRTGEYKLIGFGSCRRVFNLNNGYVVKLASDVRGIEQNKAEYSIYHNSKSPFFAEITYLSDDSRFLVMAKAKRIKKIRTVFNHYKVRNMEHLLKLNNLYEDLKNNELSTGDLGRASSWGVIDSVPVIIDYGLTHSLFKKYYGRNLLLRKRFPPLKY